MAEPVLPWDNKSRCHHNSTTTTPNTIPTFCTLSVSVFSAFAPLILLSLVREFKSSRVRDLSLHPQRLPKPERHRHTTFLMLFSSTLINYFGFEAALLGLSRFAPIFATRCYYPHLHQQNFPMLTISASTTFQLLSLPLLFHCRALPFLLAY